MNDHASQPAPAACPAEVLAQVERDHPGWHAWAGVIPHLYYARKVRSSPPMVVRATTPEGLPAAIESAERDRRR